MLITHLLLVLEVWDDKSTFRKSWVGNLGQIGLVRFDLGHHVQGQTRIAKLKSAYNGFIIGPRDLEW